MKNAFTIFFALWGSCAFGQKYNTCEMYLYNGDDSTHQILISTQTFNEAGNIVHEICNYIDKYNGLGTAKDAGLYDYYYENGLLKMVKCGAIPNSDYKYRDTTITMFYYDTNKRLSKDIVTHRMYGHPLFDTIIILEDGDTNGPKIVQLDTLDTVVTHYYYDLQGKMTSKDHWRSNDAEANGTEFFKYDGIGRIILDSDYSAREPHVTRFVYDSTGYRYTSYINSGYGGKNECILDGNKRVVELSYFYDNDDKSGVGNILYKLLYSDITEYLPDGRIAKTIHYGEYEPATTHIFVYK